MPLFEFRSTMPVSREELFAWHQRPGALHRLLPPWVDVRLISTSGIRVGDVTILSIPFGPFCIKWFARHSIFSPPAEFQDEQIRGPFARWVHTHQFAQAESGDPADASVLSDRVEFELPFGRLGNWLGARRVNRKLDSMFRFRHGRMRLDLQRHCKFPRAKPLRIAITGASGSIGRELRHFLTTGGHIVHAMVRRNADKKPGDISWDPASGNIDSDALEGLDAVVHLAGENVFTRWTEERKARFAASRVDATRFLCQTLARLRNPPAVLVCASAIGFYGDRGDEFLDESSSKSKGFLADLCQEWEAAAAPAVQAGIRVVHPRIGAVLSARGGALRHMLTAVKFGVGAIGSGQQFISWIAMDDMLGIIYESIFNPAIVGAVNATAPNPLTDRDFLKTVGRILRRPALVRIPEVVVKLIFGEMGKETILRGARVIPVKLQSAGFEFAFPTLESALRMELGLLPTSVKTT